MKFMRSSKTQTRMVAACCLLGFTQVANADSAEILCSTAYVIECGVETSCAKVSALTADAPKFIRVNLNGKSIETIREGDRKQVTKIQSMVRSDGLALLQGVEAARKGVRSAIGWTMSMDESNGSMVITASGRDVSYTLFGSCTSLD